MTPSGPIGNSIALEGFHTLQSHHEGWISLFTGALGHKIETPGLEEHLQNNGDERKTSLCDFGKESESYRVEFLREKMFLLLSFSPSLYMVYTPNTFY